MFGKKAPGINVDEAVATLLQMAGQDAGVQSLLTGLLSQTAIRQQAMTKALIAEWKQKGERPELVTALGSLLNIDVAKRVRDALLK